jgi:hypothetical protein
MSAVSLLGPQFEKKVGKQTAKVLRKFPPKTIADAVYDQLTEDYPKSAIEWVHKIKWIGPKTIPVSKVDFSEDRTWAASHEPEKVRAWEQRIRSAENKGEHVKPSLVIQRPGKTAMIPDGHHRAIAYKNLNEPIYAWIGKPGKAKGPWDILHDQQYKEGTGPQKGGNPGMYHYGKEPR